MCLACARSLFLFAFIACVLTLGATFYLQLGVGLDPCLLCLVQRAALAVAALLSLAAAWHAPTVAGWRRYGVGMFLVALFGAGMAGSQVWLQTATDDQIVPIVAGLEASLSAMALAPWVDRMGSEFRFCAEINWTLFGISLPEWSLLAFVALMLLACYPVFASFKRPPVTEGRVGD
jgi:disulfide bond formation protein DsbB